MREFLSAESFELAIVLIEFEHHRYSSSGIDVDSNDRSAVDDVSSIFEDDFFELGCDFGLPFAEIIWKDTKGGIINVLNE